MGWREGRGREGKDRGDRESEEGRIKRRQREEWREGDMKEGEKRREDMRKGEPVIGKYSFTYVGTRSNTSQKRKVSGYSSILCNKTVKVLQWEHAPHRRE
jgi:hypothetical protein